MPAGYRLDRKNKDVHEIREEEIPLKDRSGAHDDERVHDIKIVVSSLSPERPMHRVRRKCMISRKEKERHQHARDGDGATNLHYALRFVVLGGQQLVMKKAVKNVAYQDLELALLTPDGEVFSLYRERENGTFGRGKKAGSLTHGEPP